MYLLLDTKNLIDTLNIAWQGMLTIFIGMAVIYIIIFILTHPIKRKKEE
ncbi:MAG TPA: hypothetical protein PLH44_03420 [Bacilli bacterium]|jgi:TRAP-type uncharacterized transport system fused permease subunit|nr:hypothetical protein [Acholeplasmataceae bacterium]HNZ78042.1 hypothetical protein [Bacilli bacterium]HOD61264.1 hypothetical protein [Bacilli bacterium]HOE06703.1 hypothetical protein [Bacilli bacterium]HOH61890.1 hypothetical protein [Bacilli bacterium]